MEVRIGILHNPKELSVEVSESADDVGAAVDSAIAKDGGVLWLTDVKGRRVGVPASRIAYLELEADGDARRVGFGPS